MYWEYVVVWWCGCVVVWVWLCVACVCVCVRRGCVIVWFVGRVVVWLCDCVVVWVCLCGCVVVWLYGCVVVALWSWRTTIFRAGAHRAVATGTASRQPKYSAWEPIAPEPQALPRDSQNILCGSPSRHSHGHCLVTAKIFCAGAHRAVAMDTASWQPKYSMREPIAP